MSKIKLVKSAVISVFLLTLLPLPAFAYIDPGTGSYVLQIILAGILAVPFALKRYWGKIRSIFKKSK